MKRKKIKVKAPVTAKKNKQHQTSNCDISVTSAATELKFLLCVDLVQISLLFKFQLCGGTGYGDIDFKAYSMILGAILVAIKIGSCPVGHLKAVCNVPRCQALAEGKLISKYLISQFKFHLLPIHRLYSTAK